MKLLFTLLALATSLLASPSVGNVYTISSTRPTYSPTIIVSCIEGYKYVSVLVLKGTGITQMFEESKYMDSGAKPPQTIKCPKTR